MVAFRTSTRGPISSHMLPTERTSSAASKSRFKTCYRLAKETPWSCKEMIYGPHCSFNPSNQPTRFNGTLRRDPHSHWIGSQRTLILDFRRRVKKQADRKR